MWFKNIQIFQLLESISSNASQYDSILNEFKFKPCLPSLPFSYGWVEPIIDETTNDTEPKLTYTKNQFVMLCLQFEEKVLPATVVRQQLQEQITHIESTQGRKIFQKEKNQLKDEITQSLLTRAFSTFSKVYGYIDTKRNWLVIDSSNMKKIEKFMTIFQRTFANIKYHQLDIKKPTAVLTQWLLDNNYPGSFAIENKCVFQDPNQQQRIIRCQNQDLFSSTTQALLQDGFHVQQLALSWQQRIHFTVTAEFTLKNLKFDDEIISYAKENYTESKLQQFHTDFIIMTESCEKLLTDLLNSFGKQSNNSNNKDSLSTVVDIAM